MLLTPAARGRRGRASVNWQFELAEVEGTPARAGGVEHVQVVFATVDAVDERAESAADEVRLVAEASARCH